MSLLGPNLDAFMAVVAHKTVHAAAEGLCITQTAATQRIRNLEQRLKTTLFVRSCSPHLKVKPCYNIANQPAC
jgi:LysR family transcriptional regulator (chromosome initiation inhibitor)